MSVKYIGKIPERNYSVSDFNNHGIVISWAARFRDINNKPAYRCIFRSNGLLGEIRTTCFGDTFAVDVRWGWSSDQERCLTTECGSIRESKSILFEWFKSQGYVIPKHITDADWRRNYLKFAK
jgi:hypothetical protein